jgi:hypothetical protein
VGILILACDEGTTALRVAPRTAAEGAGTRVPPENRESARRPAVRVQNGGRPLRVSRVPLLLLALMAGCVTSAGAPSGWYDSSGYPLPAARRPAAPAAEFREAGRVAVLDPDLQGRIARLRAESSYFDEGWMAIVRSGVPVVIGTKEQRAARLPPSIRASRGWAAITVAFGDDRGRLREATVAIRLEWLRSLYGAEAVPEFEAALDELLVHEIYGHLVPLIVAGDLAAVCSDPEPHQRVEESCVGKRTLRVQEQRVRRARTM